MLDHTSTEWLAKLVDFLVARPLKILFIVLLAWVAAKISRRLIRRFSSQLAGSAESGRLRRARDRTPSVLLSQQQPSLRSAARAETVSQVLRSLSNAVIYSFAAVYVMAELGLQLGPLIAGAGIVGIALGFGAQSLVRDFLSGMFMLMEDQYGVGDVIDCGEAVGTVEAVSLRTTRLRDVERHRVARPERPDHAGRQQVPAVGPGAARHPRRARHRRGPRQRVAQGGGRSGHCAGAARCPTCSRTPRCGASRTWRPRASRCASS